MKSVFICVSLLLCPDIINAMDPHEVKKSQTFDAFDCWLYVYERIESLRQNYEAIKEENRLLKEQLDKACFVSIPNYTKETAKTWGVEHVAEQNGWIKLKACVISGRDEAILYINGALVLRIGIDRGCIAGVQIAPVQAGDKYIATGNPHDGIVSFFQCK
jgi:hypothetical protein